MLKLVHTQRRKVTTNPTNNNSTLNSTTFTNQSSSSSINSTPKCIQELRSSLISTCSQGIRRTQTFPLVGARMQMHNSTHYIQWLISHKLIEKESKANKNTRIYVVRYDYLRPRGEVTILLSLGGITSRWNLQSVISLSRMCSQDYQYLSLQMIQPPYSTALPSYLQSGSGIQQNQGVTQLHQFKLSCLAPDLGRP